MFFKLLNTVSIFKILIFCSWIHAFPPLKFFPSPLQNSLYLLTQNPLMPLCSPYIPSFMCSYQTSFPMYFKNHSSSSLSPQMMTPFIAEPKTLSRKRTRQILKKGEFTSFSSDSKGYHRLQTEERPSENQTYIHIEKNENKEQPQRVIRETTDSEGQYTSVQGYIKVAPTENITINRDDQWIPSPQTPSYAVTISTDETSPPLGIDEDDSKDEDSSSSLSNLSLDSICHSTEGTEAQSPCTVCHLDRKYDETFKVFQWTMSRRINNSDLCSGAASLNIIGNFNKSCSLSFTNFHPELKKRSCEKNIPPALMLAIMNVESGGNCQAMGDQDEKSGQHLSIGLFQINTQFHAKGEEGFIRQCGSLNTIHKKSIKELKSNYPQCLNNPLTSLDKGIEILVQKYKHVNGSLPPKYSCEENNISDENLDKWRRAVAAYNGGQKRIKHIDDLSKTPPEGWIEPPLWNDLSEWEKTRAYYFSCQRKDAQRRCQSITNGELIFKSSISNLAHTELVLGRNSNQTSFFKNWNDFL